MPAKDATLIIDSHAHLYDEFQPGVYFDAAYANLMKWGGAQRPADESPLAVIVLTATEWEPGFSSLCNRVELERADPSWGGWRVVPTAEKISVVVTKGDRQLIVISGAQVATAEGLEVLLVGTRDRVPDGTPTREVLEYGLACDALCILPWSPGKWWLRRGRLVDAIIEEFGEQGLVLGDTSHRPGLWRMPAQFTLARQKGIEIVPGTDPLPFPDRATHVGTLALRTQGTVDPQHPSLGVLSALQHPIARPKVVGTREPVLRCLKNQARMQLKKRGLAR